MWRGDAIEEQLSNELEAHWHEWRMTGMGQVVDKSVVWVAADTVPHPDLLAWCEKYDFTLEHDPPVEA
jgi:hypothetical protein